MTWQPGREKIAELLAAAELEQVAADRRVAQLLLDDAARHLATAAAGLSSGDLSGAYQLAYDALRKSAASLLAAQGLRATSRGGHIALQEATRAQFGSTVRAFRSFGRIRRARNAFEYPSTITPGPSPDDVSDAITTATQARDAAMTILEQNLLTPW
jgi:HEPN domain